jgi:hypothetical protein
MKLREASLQEVFVGIAVAILATGGTVLFFVDPNAAVQFWSIVTPILVGALGFGARVLRKRR